MQYTGYELIWLFFSYALAGWILETVTAALKRKRFVNRGLINAPFCVIYGFTSVLVTVFFHELDVFWLFAASFMLTTVVEWSAGHLIEVMYHEKWWDYSNIRWNFDGYVCLPVSLFWALLCVIVMKWGNPLLVQVFHLFPTLVGKIIVLSLLGALGIDMAATLIIMSGRSRRIEQWEAVDSWLTGISNRFGRWIYGHIDTRIRKAYPYAKHQAVKKVDTTVFAAGCSIDKIVWLFVIGSLLGDITETIFCRFKTGVWMSRSSLVWGPFSIVWGFAIAAATLLLYKYRHRREGFIFLVGTCLGGMYEYSCSVLSELVFGKVFWDYSSIPFNLGGRINLLYCFFWGIAAVIWLKLLYPKLSEYIERVPKKAGRILTWIFVVFMTFDMAVSGLALIRSDQRRQGIPAKQQWQVIMDERFDDARLERIYPNALEVE